MVCRRSDANSFERANELGMIVDMSHAHDEALAQAIEISKTPIILSHSGVAHLYKHPRNVPDYLLKKLAQSGGVIQINSLSGYLRDLDTSPNRLPEFIGLYRKYQNAPGGMRENHEAFIADRRALDEKYPPDYAEFSDVMDHIFYALDLMGPDHVGIGLDWDGGGGVNGLQDVSDLPKITDALHKAASAFGKWHLSQAEAIRPLNIVAYFEMIWARLPKIICCLLLPI